MISTETHSESGSEMDLDEEYDHLADPCDHDDIDLRETMGPR